MGMEVSGLIVQSVLNGFVLGGFYILVALGMTLVLSIIRFVQLAHGEIYMLGAYCVYYFSVQMGLNFFFALLISTFLVGGFGILLEKIFFRPLRGDFLRSLIVSIGLMLFIQNAVLVTAGGEPKAVPTPFPGVIKISSFTISWERLVVLIIGLGLVVGNLLFIHKTKVGHAMLAISQDREVAALQGINIDHISSIAMFLGSALAAAAGGLVGALFNVEPFMGGFALMKGIAVIILGGLGSITGTVIGGLIIGLLDGIVPPLLTTQVASLIGFGTIILILLFRPQGLLGHE